MAFQRYKPKVSGGLHQCRSAQIVGTATDVSAPDAQPANNQQVLRQSCQPRASCQNKNKWPRSGLPRDFYWLDWGARPS